MIDTLYEKLPWLYFCVKDLDITIVQPKMYNAHETQLKQKSKEELNKLEKQLIKKVKLSKQKNIQSGMELSKTSTK